MLTCKPSQITYDRGAFGRLARKLQTTTVSTDRSDYAAIMHAPELTGPPRDSQAGCGPRGRTGSLNGRFRFEATRPGGDALSEKLREHPGHTPGGCGASELSSPKLFILSSASAIGGPKATLCCGTRATPLIGRDSTQTARTGAPGVARASGRWCRAGARVIARLC